MCDVLEDDIARHRRWNVTKGKMPVKYQCVMGP